jgi:hypothetical protein
LFPAGFAIIGTMRVIVLGLFVAFFAVMPVYLLNSFVLPELNTIQQMYSQAGEIARHVGTVHNNQ